MQCPTAPHSHISGALNTFPNGLELSIFGNRGIILTFLCLHPNFVLSLEPGSAFSTQTKHGFDKHSAPQSTAPSVWWMLTPTCPSSVHLSSLSSDRYRKFHQCTGTGVPFFFPPFKSKSFPLYFHNSETTGTIC